MRMKHKLFTLLLAIAIAVTFTPLESYALEDALTFHPNDRLWDFVTESIDDDYIVGLYEKGSYFMLEYADGTEDEFDYAEGRDDEGYWTNGFYPDGDMDMEPLNIQVEKISSTGRIYPGKVNYARIGFEYRDVYYETMVEYTGVYHTEVKLSKDVYYYDGKTHTPSIKVVLEDGKGTVVPSSHYTYKWDSGRKNVGEYVALIYFKTNLGEYQDATSTSMEIRPTKPKITKVTRGKKKFTVKWKKFTKAQQKQITKFKIEYSTDKKFRKNVKTVYAKKGSTSKTIKHLKKKKTYYVRVIALKEKFIEDMEYTYEAKSKVRKVKTK